MARASIKKSTVNRAQVDERKLLRTTKKALDHNAKSTQDSYQNAILKLGMGTDNALSGSTYGFNPITRIRTLLEWIYRGSWLGAIAVDIVADDMTRAGIEINSELDPKLQDKLRHAEIKYDFWGSVNETTKWSRLYGGAIMVALIDGQDLSTEYRANVPLMPGQLKGFLVLDKWMVEARLETLVSEYGPDLGKPMFYRISSDAPALRGKNVHYSRVMRLAGLDLPYWQRVQENLWGLSVFERIYDRMVGVDSATQGAAQLVYKSFLRTYKMKGMTDLMSQGGDAGIDTMIKKMEMMRRWQSNEGITVVDADDDVTVQTNGSFAGISDVILQLIQQVSGTLQIPLVRMLGQSPAGLNSTGEADLRTYYDGINTKQEREFRRPVDKMYRMMAESEAIALPNDFNWTFRPLWQLDEGQKSEIAARDATSVAEMVEATLIDVPTGMKELKQNSRVTGRFDNITDEMIKQAEAEPPEMGLPGMGLSDTEILAGGGDPTAHEHENPANEDFPKKPPAPELAPPTPGKPNGMESKTGSVGSTSKPSKDAKPTRWKWRITYAEVDDPSKQSTIILKAGKDEEDARRAGARSSSAAVRFVKAERLEKVADTARSRDALPSYHVCGVQVSIENMMGTVRSGPGWRVEMPADYGHIPCVDSAEGPMEWMDAFVGPNRDSETVWIVDAIDPRTGKFDEHKCMLGFEDEDHARSTFEAAYHDDAVRRVGGITAMSKDEFQAWLRSGDHTRAVKK